MNIVRWRPFTEMMSLREAIDRVFDDSFIGLRPLMWPIGDGVPAVDMIETDNDLVVKATLPGVKAEDIDVSVVENTLTIRGETKTEQEAKDGDYIRREQHYGTFCRQLVLPVPVQVDKSDAKLENGVLVLTMPKAEEVKPKQIKINVHPVLEQPKAEKKEKTKK